MNKIIYSVIIALSLLVSGALAQGQAQEQQWVTYENPYFGIAIQHPPDWKVASSNTDASPPPPGFAKEIVELSASDPNTNDTSGLTIRTANARNSLDTETMQLKNATLEDFVEGKKSEIFSMGSFSTGDLAKLDYQLKYIRDNKTTVGGLPAWKIVSTSSVLGMQGAYYIGWSSV